MNIIVKPYGSELCYCRPDTTWERESRDLYSPECVKEWTWAPVAFARVSKAGKCVSTKFVERYYDSIGFGILLYGSEHLAFGSCIDHTSYLPSPLYNVAILEGTDNAFIVTKDNEEIFNTDQIGWESLKGQIEEAISKASTLISLRIGDYVAVELQPMSLMTANDTKESHIQATICENAALDFKILF